MITYVRKGIFFVRRLTNRYGNKQIFADLGYWLIPTGDSGFLKLLSGCEEFLESISPWQFIYMCSSLIRNDSGNFRLCHIVALSETAILSACDWNTSTRIFFNYFFFFLKKKKKVSILLKTVLLHKYFSLKGGVQIHALTNRVSLWQDWQGWAARRAV